MTTTLGQLVHAEPPLARLSTVRLPVKTAYHVAKLLRTVRAETVHWDDIRNSLIRELGAERDATAEEAVAGASRIIEVAPVNREEFRSRLDELANTNVEIVVTQLTLEELGTLEIAAADLDALGPLLETS